MFPSRRFPCSYLPASVPHLSHTLYGNGRLKLWKISFISIFFGNREGIYPDKMYKNDVRKPLKEKTHVLVAFRPSP